MNLVVLYCGNLSKIVDVDNMYDVATCTVQYRWKNGGVGRSPPGFPFYPVSNADCPIFLQSEEQKDEPPVEEKEEKTEN